MEALEAETAGALGGISGESTYLPVAAVGLGTYRASQYQIISIPQVYLLHFITLPPSTTTSSRFPIYLLT